MGGYLAATDDQRARMLATIGAESVDALFRDIPGEARLRAPLALPEGLSEMEADAALRRMAEKNARYRVILRGAGAYDHYIPAAVPAIVSKESFVTAYTPYQAEISQGVLQSIFEYQSMICALLDMDAANASVYDGASAAAEAMAMCVEKKRVRVLVSAAAHPDTIATMRTYAFGSGARVELVPAPDGITDAAAFEAALGDDVACALVQQPNFFGQLEDVSALAALAHARGAKLVMSCNPIAMAMLKTPGACGADIAVGEGQPLGMPLSFGGPYLGFMACTAKLTRKLPGRIVGETTDTEGRRAFVLTLQAREQHIRREKASSNICSNEALCALTAGVYMAAMGASGMRRAAENAMAKAHYLADGLCGLGLSLRYAGAFFHEFVTDGDPARILPALERRGILGGLPVEQGILWCCTEKQTRAELDEALAAAKEALA